MLVRLLWFKSPQFSLQLARCLHSCCQKITNPCLAISGQLRLLPVLGSASIQRQQNAGKAHRSGKRTPQWDQPAPKPEEIQWGTNDIEKRKGRYRPKHSWETSVKYMDSKIYRETYGDFKIWEVYRRNVKGNIYYVKKARGNCLNKYGKFRNNWLCPACRDEYIVFDYRNVKLLQQFIVQTTGEVMPLLKSGLCEKQYEQLETSVMRAREHGLLEFPVQFRNYDYREFYSWWDKPAHEPVPKEWGKLVSARPKPHIIYPIWNLENRTLLQRFERAMNPPLEKSYVPKSYEWLK